MLGMLWFANADGDHAQAGGFDFGLMPAQLGQPLAAEYSAKVTQKCKQQRTRRPQLRKHGGRARSIQQGETGRNAPNSQGIRARIF